MKRFRREGGFTIIETMLVLTVSSVIFVSGVVAFSAKQRATQFNQGVRQLDSQLQDVANDVSSGFTGGNSTLNCQDSGGAPDIETGSAAQGTSQGCITIGKAVHFSSETITVLPVIGVRTVQNGLVRREVDSLSEANPRSHDSLKSSIPLTGGLKVSKVVNNTEPPTTSATATIGFINSIGRQVSTSGQDGTLAVDLIGVKNTTIDQASSLLDHIERMKLPANVAINPKNGVIICLTDGDRRASITMGGNNSRIATSIAIDAVPGECSS